ncbi:MAG: hypothetical protein DRZ82_10240 [Thermoprotei archaeon]|nr:MAG: hypothetical protein DRZ82_10240 [Thermoprotei archaeon]
MSKPLGSYVVSINRLSKNLLKILMVIPKSCLSIAYLCIGLALIRSVNECRDGYLSLRWPNEVLCGESLMFKYTLDDVRFSNDYGEITLTLIIYEDTLASIPNLRDVQEFIARFELILSNILNDLREGLRFKYIQEYMRNLTLLGEEVLIILRDGSKISGEVLGLKLDGSLVLLRNNKVEYVDPLKVKSIETIWP